VQSNNAVSLNRRHVLRGTAAIGALGVVGGCAVLGRTPVAAPSSRIAPIDARMDRVFDITVCTRPFRPQGPRLDVEHIGRTTVVHNYGHGGSGWSLSWGSSTIAVQRAMASSPREIAVIGCGALGLTSAILAQQAGAHVTIYARDVVADARSSRATGLWSPDSRIALDSAAPAGFPQMWEQMARNSFKTYRRYLGLAGTPIEWIDQYYLYNDRPPMPAAAPSVPPAASPPALDFAHYLDRIRDITPRFQDMPIEATPFRSDHVRHSEVLTFNIASLGHTLMTDFFLAGGRFRHAEFHAPSELTRLKEKVVIDCTGYGARALWKDEALVPVRGQITWLIPEPEAHYGFFYRGVGVVCRRDGIVVQGLAGGDMRGYGDAGETPDRAEAEQTVGIVAEAFKRGRPAG
jgi:glycine/D-amino acid oxidase-like deaminating enzyme